MGVIEKSPLVTFLLYVLISLHFLFSKCGSQLGMDTGYQNNEIIKHEKDWEGDDSMALLYTWYDQTKPQ